MQVTNKAHISHLSFVFAPMNFIRGLLRCDSDSVCSDSDTPCVCLMCVVGAWQKTMSREPLHRLYTRCRVAAEVTVASAMTLGCSCSTIVQSSRDSLAPSDNSSHPGHDSGQGHGQGVP